MDPGEGDALTAGKARPGQSQRTAGPAVRRGGGWGGGGRGRRVAGWDGGVRDGVRWCFFRCFGVEAFFFFVGGGGGGTPGGGGGGGVGGGGDSYFPVGMEGYQ